MMIDAHVHPPLSISRPCPHTTTTTPHTHMQHRQSCLSAAPSALTRSTSSPFPLVRQAPHHHRCLTSPPRLPSLCTTLTQSQPQQRQLQQQQPWRIMPINNNLRPPWTRLRPFGTSSLPPSPPPPLPSRLPSLLPLPSSSQVLRGPHCVEH